MITELHSEEAHALLRHGKLGRLGCIAEGEPYVIPVHYLCEGDSIYVHSLPGRKITALRAHPRACFQVDEIKDAFHWQSVLISGSYEEITDSHERERILCALFARLPHLTPVESAMTSSTGLAETIIFRLRIEAVTGVREK